MPTIAIQRHLPERPHRASAVAPAGAGCCCCCCCCLHSVGGLIASAVVPAKPPETDGTRKIYWTTFAVLAFVPLIAYLFAEGGDRREGVTVALIIWSIFVPAIQLTTSVVAAVVIGMKGGPNQGPRLRHLLRMTLYGILGAFIGGLVMIPLFMK